jgi:hypothetical protein
MKRLAVGLMVAASPALAQVKVIDPERGITSVQITIPMDDEVKTFALKMAWRLNNCSMVSIRMVDLSVFDMSTRERRAAIEKAVPPCPDEAK